MRRLGDRHGPIMEVGWVDAARHPFRAPRSTPRSAPTAGLVINRTTRSISNVAQSNGGFRWRFKTFSDEIIVETLPNDQVLVRRGVRADSIDQLARHNNGVAIEPRTA